jgi:SAM-dependent methyltransferase
MDTNCRACGGHTRFVVDLGLQPPSNGYLKHQRDFVVVYPLNAFVCEVCHLMQVDYDVPPYELFGADYAYFSGGSKQWVEHNRQYAQMAIESFALNSQHSVVIEVGGNDGSQLQFFKGRVARTINIEPSASVAAASIAAGIETWVEYFQIPTIQADLIIANNVLAHTPDPAAFIQVVSSTLKPSGIATFEFPHALELLRETQFDTIYHEHYSYLSMLALRPILEKHGLKIFNVEKLPTHGGSLRLYVTRRTHLQPSPAVKLLETEEEELKDPNLYEDFAIRTVRCKHAIRQFLGHNRGKKILAYGAAAKGNTFLNYCNITAADIPLVGDVTPAKQGKFLPGSRIGVVSEAVLLAEEPDYILILAWNWRDEIVARLRGLGYAGKFVTAIPRLETL